jgi:hypothetical protein
MTCTVSWISRKIFTSLGTFWPPCRNRRTSRLIITWVDLPPHVRSFMSATRCLGPLLGGRAFPSSPGVIMILSRVWRSLTVTFSALSWTPPKRIPRSALHLSLTYILVGLSPPRSLGLAMLLLIKLFVRCRRLLYRLSFGGYSRQNKLPALGVHPIFISVFTIRLWSWPSAMLSIELSLRRVLRPT